MVTSLKTIIVSISISVGDQFLPVFLSLAEEEDNDLSFFRDVHPRDMNMLKLFNQMGAQLHMFHQSFVGNIVWVSFRRTVYSVHIMYSILHSSIYARFTFTQLIPCKMRRWQYGTYTTTLSN